MTVYGRVKPLGAFQDRVTIIRLHVKQHCLDLACTLDGYELSPSAVHEGDRQGHRRAMAGKEIKLQISISLLLLSLTPLHFPSVLRT